MDTQIELTDYMGFQGLLDDEESLVRQTARAFVNKEVIPIIDEYAQKEKFPAHLVKMMGELGFLGSNLPEKYGCAGLSNVGYGLLMYELERGEIPPYAVLLQSRVRSLCTPFLPLAVMHKKMPGCLNWRRERQ